MKMLAEKEELQDKIAVDPDLRQKTGDMIFKCDATKVI